MNTRADLVPLADRLAALLGARFLIAGTTVAASLTDVVGDPSLAALSIAFLVASSGLEGARRLLRRRGLQLVSSLLVVDGVFLAVVVAQSGGTGSHLLFLVHLHIVACTLLASFRTGVLVAVWHAILLVVAQHLHWVPEADRASVDDVLLTVASFLIVAGAAVAFTSLNERELRRSRRSATALVGLGTALEASRTIEEVAAVGAAHLRHRLGHRAAAVLVRDDDCWTGASDDGRGTVRFTADAPVEAVGEVGDVPVLASAIDASTAPLLDRVLPDARNVVVVELVADGERIGVAAVECGADRPRLPTHELATVAQSATRIALSVRTAQLLREVERLAGTDPLTGLPNRRLFDATLDREVARARRSGAALSVALLDVDHFKAVNDHHGHQVGDEVLCELAAALRGAARRDSMVARYGGEEFVVLLPDASADAAVVAAERLRTAAAGVHPVPVTISVGVAVLEDGWDSGDVVGAADTALYEAKERGRNRTVRFGADAGQLAGA